MSIVANMLLIIYLAVAAIILLSTINYSKIFEKLRDTIETTIIALFWPFLFVIAIYFVIRVMLGNK